MKLDFVRARKLLKAFDFQTLFREELGWEPYRYDLDLTVNGEAIRVQTLAYKRGFYALRLHGDIPPYAMRRKIEALVAKSYHEHLIIYADAAQTTQVWQWVKREPGQPAASRETTFRREGSGQALLQKLEHLVVTLDEEERLTILDVAERVKSGFDVERVTKRFYDRFKDEHAAFLTFVKGIPEEGMQRWYVSVTLNRLMFVYFIQKKGFLNGDADYLRHQLAESQKRGQNLFYTDFLCPLFFKGFAQKKHDAETVKLLGKVPYLNGGIFAKHQIEERHGEKIKIPDAAFEQLFAFFEDYQWHLDERPLRDDKEINPDVLGYIFEKYINQRQMGAYYTREDITGYNSKNTIIPHLFDVARKECKIGFEEHGSVWRLLKDNPDRYIYPPVRHGAGLPLPVEIAKGLKDPARRQGWNKPAPAEFALPTEIWREVVARRQKYEEIKRKLEAGEIREINDLITLNLDIRQFAQDVIENAEGVDLLRAFWKAILSVTVLDPTVGSGAFLFAALNVLEPLYEACLERMQVFVDELERASSAAHRPEKYSDFKKVLAETDRHPNRRYFILKSIIVNNLYGVDIMDEAVEICKLRLFLKLVAQVERVEQIEPLPDIDFNIRAGNTLVGFAAKDDVRRAMEMASGGQMKMVSTEEDAILKRIEDKAQDVERLFGLFRQQQTELGGEVRPEDKAELQRRLKELEDELNVHLARQYGIHNSQGEAFKKWLDLHKPFHWFVDFYRIMRDGGFDVIIGNPPYVENSKIRNEYSIIGYETEVCGNLYTLVIERSLQLASKTGRFGMIVPMSIVSTERMTETRQILFENMGTLYFSNYSGDAHPSILFNGVKMRLTIVLAHRGSKLRHLFTTKFMRWLPVGREYLFESVSYAEVPEKMVWNGLIPKASENTDIKVLTKVFEIKRAFNRYVLPTSPYSVYSHRIVAHFVKCFDFIPYFRNERDGEKKSEDYKVFSFKDQSQALLASAFLNSSLFYYFYLTYSDAYHCGRELILGFPCNLDSVDDNLAEELRELNKKLMKDLITHGVRRRIEYHGTGLIEYDEFYPRLSKPFIDEIDRALARHYGLTAEELDFIINYDVKYRLGAGEED